MAEPTEADCICLRYQEVRGDGLAFSCECAGEGCPDEPLANWEREYAREQWEALRRATEETGQ